MYITHLDTPNKVKRRADVGDGDVRVFPTRLAGFKIHENRQMVRNFSEHALMVDYSSGKQEQNFSMTLRAP